jgi:hypothetical protein
MDTFTTIMCIASGLIACPQMWRRNQRGFASLSATLWGAAAMTEGPLQTALISTAFLTVAAALKYYMRWVTSSTKQ